MSYINEAINPSDPKATEDETLNSFFLLESKILELIDFDLEVEVPLGHLIEFNNSFHSRAKERYETNHS